MIVIIDDRKMVLDGYESMFKRLGYPVLGFNTREFRDFSPQISRNESYEVFAIIVGEYESEIFDIYSWKSNTSVPVIAALDQSSLTTTLSCFERGADDVVKKPTHARELIARIAAIRRRGAVTEDVTMVGGMKIHFDGRDPEIFGKPFPLPRRERRILEYLASIGKRRASREQVYNAVYGILEQDIEESVVESHISKLRKKLKSALGYDVIDSKRFLGYRLIDAEDLEREHAAHTMRSETKSSGQKRGVSLGQELAVNF